MADHETCKREHIDPLLKELSLRGFGIWGEGTEDPPQWFNIVCQKCHCTHEVGRVYARPCINCRFDPSVCGWSSTVYEGKCQEFRELLESHKDERANTVQDAQLAQDMQTLANHESPYLQPGQHVEEVLTPRARAALAKMEREDALRRKFIDGLAYTLLDCKNPAHLHMAMSPEALAEAFGKSPKDAIEGIPSYSMICLGTSFLVVVTDASFVFSAEDVLRAATQWVAKAREDSDV